MSSPILERIEREIGIPGLIDALVERLTPTDLQSLLLEVYRRRAAGVSPRQLLERYEQDRFARPTEIAPDLLASFDQLARSLLPEHYTAIELSPVCPLGTNASVATVDQNKVISTIRNSEVVADITNVLALECAVRRRHLLRQDPQSRQRVGLSTSQRVARAQVFQAAPGVLPHFRLFGLCTAGRDEGSFLFEATSLVEQISFYARLLHEFSHSGYQTQSLRVAITELEGGRREAVLAEQVFKPLLDRHPTMRCAFDPERQTGRGYYTGVCFHIYAIDATGNEVELTDGGFTSWTQQLLSNKKERLLISGLGVERIFHLLANHPG